MISRPQSPYRTRRKAFCSLLAALLSLTACVNQPSHKVTDQLVYRIPNYASGHWTVINQREAESGSVTFERLREGDTESNWKEMVVSESHAKDWGGQVVEQALAALQQHREKACQNPIEWKILAQAPTSIIYEGRAKTCNSAEAEYELGRIFDGPTTRFRLAYLSQDPNLPADQRAKWLLMLQEASTR